jgi:hypothetical protein
MRLSFPKNDKRYYWTQHCIKKMLFYGISAVRIKKIIENPKRMEKGIAPNTLAAMQPSGKSKKPSEIWTMYAIKGLKKIIITAWRYPGISPIGKQVPIPNDILEDLKKML